jgi:hypothetical protein
MVGTVKRPSETNDNFFLSNISLNKDLLSKIYDVSILVNLENHQ